jgi:hypothetical protein
MRQIVAEFAARSRKNQNRLALLGTSFRVRHAAGFKPREKVRDEKSSRAAVGTSGFQ